ncbi:MAG: hypothetical protein LBQ54_02345 [Planctomycetaceae bacterium]|nr:hypothetical protein [Planctomycetaceae bacterium]
MEQHVPPFALLTGVRERNNVKKMTMNADRATERQVRCSNMLPSGGPRRRGRRQREGVASR